MAQVRWAAAAAPLRLMVPPPRLELPFCGSRKGPTLVWWQLFGAQTAAPLPVPPLCASLIHRANPPPPPPPPPSGLDPPPTAAIDASSAGLPLDEPEHSEAPINGWRSKKCHPSRRSILVRSLLVVVRTSRWLAPTATAAATTTGCELLVALLDRPLLTSATRLPLARNVYERSWLAAGALHVAATPEIDVPS